MISALFLQTTGLHAQEYIPAWEDNSGYAPFSDNPIFRAGPPGGGPSDGGDEEFEGDPVITEIPVTDAVYFILLLVSGYSILCWRQDKKNRKLIFEKQNLNRLSI